MTRFCQKTEHNNRDNNNASTNHRFITRIPSAIVREVMLSCGAHQNIDRIISHYANGARDAVIMDPATIVQRKTFILQIFSQIQKCYWYTIDTYDIKHMRFRSFAVQMCRSVQALQMLAENFHACYHIFIYYCHTIPTCGAILMSNYNASAQLQQKRNNYCSVQEYRTLHRKRKTATTTMTTNGDDNNNNSMQNIKVLLVRSKKTKLWSWPKGKVEYGESYEQCAVREVCEETSYNIAKYLNKSNYFQFKNYDEILYAAQHRPVTVLRTMRLYWIPNVQHDYKFLPKHSQEIDKIEWFDITQLAQHCERNNPLFRIIKNSIVHILRIIDSGNYAATQTYWLYETNKLRKGIV